MRRPGSVRGRLTVLYTAVFAAGGVVLLAAVYLLVAHSIGPTPAGKPSSASSEVRAARKEAAQTGQPLLGDLQAKCKAAFQLGVESGAAAHRRAALRSLLLYSGASLAGMLLLAAWAGWILAGRVIEPVRLIADAARAAGERDLSQRVALGGPRDELRELADTFDEMLDRLQDAFASQSRFLANAGHELRTPLTTMRTTLDVVLAKPNPTTDELLAMGRDVRTAVDDAAHLIDALLMLARSERGLTVHDRADLASVAADVLPPSSAADPRVEARLEPAVVVGDPVLLRRLVANLVDNATRYNVPSGHVGVTTQGGTAQAALVIRNTGPVVPADRVQSLLDPFHRLDPRTGTGLGLGLTIAQSIARMHGGELRLAPVSTGGLEVELRLPAPVT